MKTLLALLALASLSCATMKDDQTVCAEYRSMRCMAGATCHLDKSRGCKVCQCESVSGAPGADGNPTVNGNIQGAPER